LLLTDQSSSDRFEKYLKNRASLKHEKMQDLLLVAQIIQYSLSVSVNMVIKVYSYARIGCSI